MTYLDYNASAPVLDVVIDAISETLRMTGNPSSQHSYGRQLKALLRQARQDILASAGAGNADLVFTSSGTEANNLALHGIGHGAIATSSVEHLSILEPAKKRGAYIIPVNRNGMIKLDLLESWLQKQGEGALVSIQVANSETGIIQPVDAILRLTRAYKAFLHMDSTQAYGKISWSFDDTGVDAATLSAHKIGGPKGIGALIIKKGLPLKPMFFGGAQEKYRRAGTENIAGIAGFQAAANHLELTSDRHKRYIRQHFADYPDSLIGGECDQLPNTLAIRMPGVKNHTQLIHFDLHGIAVSSGSACSSGKVEASHVLLAMGFTPENATEVIRLSYGKETTQSDIDAFLKVWKTLHQQTKGMTQNASVSQTPLRKNATQSTLQTNG